MPSITPVNESTVPCFRNSGTSLPQSQRVKTFGITGVDGVGVHILGKFGNPSTWTVMQYGTVVFLEKWFASLTEAQGKICTFVNDENKIHYGQLLEGVAQPQKKTAFDGAGSEELWTVQVRARTV